MGKTIKYFQESEKVLTSYENHTKILNLSLKNRLIYIKKESKTHPMSGLKFLKLLVYYLTLEIYKVIK
jgi:hypothetical protein